MTDINGNVTTVAPDPDAMPGQAPSADQVGERFASLTAAQRSEVGLLNNGETIRPETLVNDPSTSSSPTSLPVKSTETAAEYNERTFQSTDGTAADNEAAEGYDQHQNGTVINQGVGSQEPAPSR